VITVLSWLWKQPQSRAHFGAHNVNVWAAMVRRHTSQPVRIACVTDLPQGIDPSIQIITPPGDFVGLQTPTWCNGKPNCFRRLAMFRRDAGKLFGNRFVSMDLDCVIGGSLDPLLDRKEDLVLFKGTSERRPYNGSLMLMTAGCRPQVYDDFTAEEAAEAGIRFRGSDQSWLAYKLGWDEATFDASEGVRFWPDWQPKSKDVPRILFFPGKLKPWDISAVVPFVRDNYRLDMREAA
jgi:hypothetical protein